MAGMDSLTKNGKGFGVLAITLAVVLAILQGFGDTLTGTANTTLNSFIGAFSTFGTFAAIIVLAIVGFYVLGLVNSKK